MAKKVEKEENVKEEVKEEKKNNRHEVVVKIEGESWKKAMDKAFAKKQKTAKVDGFRTGKVPRDIYEKHYGKESLYMDATENVMEEAYNKAMEDSKLVPVAQPDVNIKSLNDDHVEFIFKIITKPEVTVKKYQGLNIQPEKVEVTDLKSKMEKWKTEILL